MELVAVNGLITPDFSTSLLVGGGGGAEGAQRRNLGKT